MFTKSLIQQQIERENLLESFEEYMNDLMDKYTIEDGVFSMSKSNAVVEAVRGYFVENNEYDNIRKSLEDAGNAIRVINNEKFVSGTIYENLNSCPQDKKILDLQTLNYVN